jgi:hypothetical protein
MMYYRRKILLALLQEFNNRLSKTSLQKLLFLFTRQQQVRAYDFVPYKYGCYSHQSNYDLNVLIKYKIIEEVSDHSWNYWIKADQVDYVAELNVRDRQILKEICSSFRSLSQDELIKYTYLHYPYYATKSQILSNILSQAEISKVNDYQVLSTEKQFFTIGYEGKNLDYYLNQLVTNDVRLLIDVRKNPISMKWGYSKSQLMPACVSQGIKYMHIPELGIESGDRKNLQSVSDYKVLFAKYELSVRKDFTTYLYKIIEEIKINDRVAIGCFEGDPCMCHRGKVAEIISTLPEWNFSIKHL